VNSFLSGVENRWHRLQGHASFRAAALYIGASWVLLQGIALFGASLHALRVIAVVLVLGLVAVITLARSAEQHAAQAEIAATVTRRPAWSDRLLTLVRGHRWAVVALALVILGTVGWWLRPRLFAHTVVPGADVIAVLPFTTTGASATDLGEGMVDLLSTSLDHVGGIRTLDPRLVVRRWRDRARERAVDLNEALALGRELNAGSVLVGSAVAAGRAVKLTATLHAVDGTRLARAAVTGSADSIFTLVDALAVDLLRDIWRSREPLPSVHLSEVTTSSLAGIRAYLPGVKYYRTSQWDSAQKYLDIAVREDSAFALALALLGDTYGWTQGLGSTDERRFTGAAARHANRLPERQRLLIVGRSLHSHGDIAAIDSLRLYTQRYPEDVIGWYYYADALYHSLALRAPSWPEAVAPFSRVVQMDSSLTPALDHPLDVAVLLTHDRPLYDRVFPVFSRFGAPLEVARYRQFGIIAFARLDSSLSAFGSAMRSASPTRNTDVTYPVWSLTNRAIHAVDTDGSALAAGADSLWNTTRLNHLPATENKAVRLGNAAYLWLAAGQPSRAKEAIDSLLVQNAPWAELVLSHAAATGIATPQLVAAATQRMHDPPPSADAVFSRAAILMSRGDYNGARKLASTTFPHDTLARYPYLPGLMEAINAWAVIAKGDTASGIPLLRQALNHAGYAPRGLRLLQPVLFALAVALTRRADTREEGLRRLAYFETVVASYAAPAELARADAMEAAGDRAGAATAYANVLRLWKYADPSLQPRVAAARQKLERLTREAQR
jgi:tetratricopeptide (TPR) repeat protein